MNALYDVEKKIEFFSVLADKTRQEIIFLFYKKKEACVTYISEQFELSRPTISHHLLIMKRAGILKSRKEGKEVYYSFNKEFVIEQMEELLLLVKKCC